MGDVSFGRSSLAVKTRIHKKKKKKTNTPSSIKSLVIFFGPMLLPKAIGLYRSVRNNASSQQQRKPIIPLRHRPLLAILILVFAALALAITALPIFSPENIFTITRSNPSSSNNLIATRLATLRPLTPRDAVLHDKFESKASKLLYYKYGPDVLAECPFCSSQDPTTYLVYALPSILLPHLVSAVVIGLATSDAITGPEGRQFRVLATYAAGALAAADIYFAVTWDHVTSNEKARVLAEIDFFFWTSRRWRQLALALTQVVLAGAVYVACTNRFFVVGPTVSARIDAVREAMLGGVNMKVRSANVLKNTVARDAELRALDAAYWAHEGQVVQEAMESEEVVESMRDAVENRRINMEEMDRMAEGFTERVVAEVLVGM